MADFCLMGDSELFSDASEQGVVDHEQREPEPFDLPQPDPPVSPDICQGPPLAVMVAEVADNGFHPTSEVKKRRKRKRDPLGPQPEFTCAWPYCGKAFEQAPSLAKHIAMSHEKDPSTVCEECGRDLGKRKALVDHVARHRNRNRYLCVNEGCGKGFAKSYDLKRHCTTCKFQSPAPAKNECEQLNNMCFGDATLPNSQSLGDGEVDSCNGCITGLDSVLDSPRHVGVCSVVCSNEKFRSGLAAAQAGSGSGSAMASVGTSLLSGKCRVPGIRKPTRIPSVATRLPPPL